MHHQLGCLMLVTAGNVPERVGVLSAAAQSGHFDVDESTKTLQHAGFGCFGKGPTMSESMMVRTCTAKSEVLAAYSELADWKVGVNGVIAIPIGNYP